MTVLTSIMGLVYLALIIYGISIIFQVARYLKVRIQHMEKQKKRDEELLAEVKALRNAIEHMK